VIIYKTTNLINGRIYVGKDKHNNPKYLGSGNILHQAIKKYGKENFQKEILEYCNTEEELCEKEKYWIDKLNSLYINGGYNLTKGGEGGDTFTNKPEELKSATRNKISEISSLSNQKNIELHRTNSLRNWKNDTYRNKVIDGLKRSWQNTDRVTKFKARMKEVCNTPEMKSIRSKNALGSNNSTWKGYADLYSPEDKFIKRYECIGYLKKDIELSFQNSKEIRSGQTEIIIKSSRKRKLYYENYIIRLVKK
jgi:group I intron endonuclease